MSLENIWNTIGAVGAGSSSSDNNQQYLQAQQAQTQKNILEEMFYHPFSFPQSALGQGIAGAAMGVNPNLGMSHLGVVREFRRKFKEYSKVEFREVGSSPVIKDILSGMTKLNKEEIKDRIAEHLAVA